MSLKRLNCCDYALIIIGVLLVVLGIVGLSVWPTVFNAIVNTQLQLTHNREDESLGFATHLYTKPPMKNAMNFYVFNVTNEDEMKYEGAQPRVLEVGPFTWVETEQKRYLQFSDDDTKMYYQNYKTWVFDRSLSCPTCEHDSPVNAANAPAIGAASALQDPHYNVNPLAKLIIGFGLLVLGENPISAPPAGALLFDGYDDALLDVGHSKLVDILSVVFNGGKSIIPLPIPPLRKMGYFMGYNNTNDEEYWIRTGTDDINRMGEVITWGNHSLLPESWWTTTQARMINGSDTGSMAHSHLTPDSVIPMFHSYMCRSFNAEYVGKRDVEGVPSMTFSVREDEWDTTLDRNRGFRYQNYENRRYFPDWPHCPKYNSSNCIARPDEIDCSLAENLCDDCCILGKHDGTWLTPPGIIPLVCYPGRLQQSPFALVLSPPHFLYSPKQVTKMVGINPVEGKHNPMVYDREPNSGMVTEVAYRVQLSMPMFENSDVIQNNHLPRTMLPVWYEDCLMKMSPFAYNFYRLGFVISGQVVLGLCISLIILGFILLLAFAIKYCRKPKYE